MGHRLETGDLRLQTDRLYSNKEALELHLDLLS